MRFVVIGGDAAGMSAASRAKRNRPDLEVIVLEQSEDVSYSACGMPYNIADPDREMDDLVVRTAEAFREKQGIDLRTGHRVDTIDVGNREVSGVDFQGRAFHVPYDKLLIATGASAMPPDLPGFDLSGVFVLRSLEHGRMIRRFIKTAPVQKAIIIGMGYIALEMCESLRAREIDVVMVKPGPDLLPWMSREMSSVVRSEIEGHQVRLYPGRKIMGIEKKDDNLIVRCEDLDLEGQMVLVATGIRPNSDMAGRAGLVLGPSSEISVGRDMKTSNENIYAAGDCADAFHVVTGKKTWIPLALRANRGGWAVADNVTGKSVELEGVAGTAAFQVFDLQVARTGLGVKESEKSGFDPVEMVIKSRSRAHAHPGSSTLYVQMVGDRISGRILGAQMVGKESAAHRINALAVALHQAMTVEAFSRCDLAYAPPFGPVWDPMLTCANQLLKKLRG